jgi:ABC-type antimicrobial peptide transport system permease subunit
MNTNDGVEQPIRPKAGGGLGLVVLRWRVDMRAHWRSVLALVLVVGIGGGAALAGFAGARRTDTALGRFLTYDQPGDGGFLFGSQAQPPAVPGLAPDSLALAPIEQRVVDLPQVESHFRAPYLFVATRPTGSHVGDLNVLGPGDPELFRSMDRPLIIAGRLPDPRRADEAVVNDFAAAQSHLRLGSMVRLYAYSYDQIAGGALASAVSLPMPAGPSFSVHVVGIIRQPADVSAILPVAAKQKVSYEGQQNLFTSPAFLPQYATGLGIPVNQIPDINLVSLRLHHGFGDWAAFASAANTIAQGSVDPTPGGDLYAARSAAASAQRGVHVDVVVLLLFASLTALITLVFVGQAIARQVSAASDDFTTLRQLGATRRQLVLVVMARATVIGVAGGTLALAVAYALSAFTPVGLARQAEIHPGAAFDATLLVPCAVALAALVVAWSALPAWRVSRWGTESSRRATEWPAPSRVAESLARGGAPASAVIGVCFGFEGGRGRGAVPVMAAFTAAVVAVGALVAALTFGTSLNRMVSSPRTQGWNWDVLVGNPNDFSDHEQQMGAALGHNHLIGAYSAIAMLAGPGQGAVEIDGKPVLSMLAVDQLKGSVHPPLLQGRAPRGTDEIALAPGTMQALHRHIGDRVHIATPVGTLALRIVGEFVSPAFGDILSDGVGDGAWVDGAAVHQVQSEVAANGAGGGGEGAGLPPTVFSMFFVRYAPGVSSSAAYTSLQRDFGPVVLTQLPSSDALNLQSVDRLPLLFSILVALIGVITVGNTLIVSVRRRRRDLAVLKTIGFVRSQVAATVGWQTVSYMTVAVVVGIPLGLIVGRWVWAMVSGSIDSVSPLLIPAAGIVTVGLAAFVLGLALAMFPAWSAARVRPAVAMRTE